MSILDQFTIVQRNRIEAVWRKHGEGEYSHAKIVAGWAEAILANPVEMALLAWSAWFGGPAVAGTAVMAFNWLMALGSVLTLIVLGTLMRKANRLPDLDLDDINLRSASILLAFDKGIRRRATLHWAMNLATLATIAATGRYVQAGLLLALAVVTPIPVQRQNREVREYVYGLDEEG